MAEEDLYYSLGWPRPEILRQLQIGFPRVETWARFRKPARQGDLMEVTTWIARRTRRSLLFQFELHREGDPELAVEGSYTVVCVNRLFHSIPLPPEFVERMREYLPPLSERTAPMAEGAGE
jgi:acyl-CoA thioesterase FadM